MASDSRGERATSRRRGLAIQKQFDAYKKGLQHGALRSQLDKELPLALPPCRSREFLNPSPPASCDLFAAQIEEDSPACPLALNPRLAGAPSFMGQGPRLCRGPRVDVQNGAAPLAPHVSSEFRGDIPILDVMLAGLFVDVTALVGAASGTIHNSPPDPK